MSAGPWYANASSIEDSNLSGESIKNPLIPYASAIFIKSGWSLNTEWENRLLKNLSCHCFTIPKVPLLISTILTLSPYSGSKAISWFVIWKPPSPTKHTTVFSGSANCAPIADGIPKPPLVTHCP